MPVPVTGLDDAVSISVGGLGNCAIREGGQVVCWGYNYDDRMGVGLDREVLTVPTPVVGMDDAEEIFTDSATHCAIRASSEVWCWGYDTYGAAGNGYQGGTEFSSSEFPVPVRTG
jgi:alpha-tubulin suppressor-like RCC1 family protein